MRYPIAFSTAVLFIAGCASSPVTTTDAQAVSSSAIYAPEVFIQAPNKAQITLIRDSSFGGQCALGIYLDGKLVAGIKREEKVVMYVSPGTHIVGAGPNPNGVGVCKMFAEKLRRETGITPSLDRPVKLRLAMLSGAISITPTSF